MMPASTLPQTPRLMTHSGTLQSVPVSLGSTSGREEAAVLYAKGGPPAGWGPAATHKSSDETVALDNESAHVAPVIVLPVRAVPRQRFIPMSRREGVVLEIRQDEFDARLVDLDGAETDLEATFAIEELSPDDVALLRAGAVFYWTIGYFDDHVRRRTRVSELRFRRLPSEDSNVLAEAEAEADQIRRELGLD